MQASSDPKQGERDYYRHIGAEGLAHAKAKPFSDHRTGHYLADLGALLILLPPPPARILDLGCGTGWTSRFLGKAGYTVVGIDIAPEAIQAATDSLGPEEGGRVTFQVGDYETPPAQGVFDYVLFYDALHHAEDETAALRCAYHALKPKGAVFAFEPGKGHRESESSIRAVREFGVHEKEMPPRYLKTLGQRVGFRSAVSVPTPHELARTLYRRDFLDLGATPGKLWMEKIWGYFRSLHRMTRLQRGALTILLKRENEN